VATALMKNYFNDHDWDIGNPILYKEILMLFNDKPESLFSIHNIAEQGLKMGKTLGSWLGPNSIAVILSHLSHQKPIPLAIYNTKQLIIEEKEVKIICGGDHWNKSLLLLIPCQLGLNQVNPIYLKSLSLYLQIPQSIGFIGGRPNSAYYFVGIQDENLYYLDPHVTQQVADVSSKTTIEGTESYFCSLPKAMNIKAIDESLALGFFCKNQTDWNDFQNRISLLNKSSDFNSLFSIEEISTESKKNISINFDEDDFDMSDSDDTNVTLQPSDGGFFKI